MDTRLLRRLTAPTLAAARRQREAFDAGVRSQERANLHRQAKLGDAYYMTTQMPDGIENETTKTGKTRIRTRVESVDGRQVARFGQWEISNA